MKHMSKKMAITVAKGLKNVLKVEANTTSSFIIYQPKAPKELKRFRSDK